MVPFLVYVWQRLSSDEQPADQVISVTASGSGSALMKAMANFRIAYADAALVSVEGMPDRDEWWLQVAFRAPGQLTASMEGVV